MNTPSLMAHQKEDAAWMLKQKRVLNASEMGSGKSLTALEGARLGKFTKTLIICPAALKENWNREVAKWFPDWPVTVLEGPPAKRMDILEGFSDGILIANYEQVRCLRDETYTPESTTILKMKFDALIVDEAHYIKSRPKQAKVNMKGEKEVGQLRSRGIRRLARNIPHLWLMTGTPITNRVPEMWSYLNLIDSKKWSSYYRFVKEHCEITSNPFSSFVVGDTAKNPAKLKREIAAVVHRRRKEDVLDLPPKVHQVMWVDLYPKERRFYDELEKEWLAEFEARVRSHKEKGQSQAKIEAVLAPVIIALITRLKQICVAPDMIAEGGIGWHTAKMEMLLQLIEGTDEKVVVFSQFRRAIDIAEEMLFEKKMGYIRYTGAENKKQRIEGLDAFQAQKEKQVALVTIQAGGVGLNGLQVAPYAVFLDKLWTPAANEQAEDRLHRKGQEKPVTIYELLATNTVEERIEAMLNHKEGLIGSVLGRKEKVFV